MSRTRAEARTITERKRVGMKRQAAPRRGGSRRNEARAARGQRNHGRIAGLLQHPLHVKGLGSPPLPTRSFYSVINLRPAPPSRSGRPPCRWQTESPSERRINFSTVKEREERTRRGGCVRHSSLELHVSVPSFSPFAFSSDCAERGKTRRVFGLP